MLPRHHVRTRRRRPANLQLRAQALRLDRQILHRQTIPTPAHDRSRPANHPDRRTGNHPANRTDQHRPRRPPAPDATLGCLPLNNGHHPPPGRGAAPTRTGRLTQESLRNPPSPSPCQCDRRAAAQEAIGPLCATFGAEAVNPKKQDWQVGRSATPLFLERRSKKLTTHLADGVPTAASRRHCEPHLGRGNPETHGVPLV